MNSTRLDQINRGNPFSLFGGSKIDEGGSTQKKDKTEKTQEQQSVGQVSSVQKDLDQAPRVKLDAKATAEGVRDQLKQKGIDAQGAEALAAEMLKDGAQISEAQMQAALNRVGGTEGTTRLSETERTQLVQDIRAALEASKKEAEGLNGQGGVGRTEGANRDMNKHVDAFHAAVNVALETAQQSSRVIKMHLSDIEKRNDTVRQLLDLSDLMTKYEDRESLCLSDPESVAMEKDFNRMQELIFVAKGAGINWDCKGGWAWGNKTDFKRFTQGLAACIGALQSQNKVKDLQMQQAVQAFQALILLCTTLLLLASQTKKSIVQNIVR